MQAPSGVGGSLLCRLRLVKKNSCLLTEKDLILGANSRGTFGAEYSIEFFFHIGNPPYMFSLSYNFISEVREPVICHYTLAF